MIRPRFVLRLLGIQRILLRHGLDEIILATHLFRPLRFVRHLNPASWRRGERPPRAVRIRRALVELGPIFVKFGQALSTRRDLLPADLADELAKLQDRVPPFPGSEARAIAERIYGKRLEEVFASFDDVPFAAASIAQVHQAELKDGQSVIVKILRPGMGKQIDRDLAVLLTIAELAQRYWAPGRRLRPVEVVREYEKTVTNELDLMREAANAAQLRRNFADSDLLYVPEVYWDYCRPRILVMERVSGIPVSDLKALREAGTDLGKLANVGVEIFFTQVFRHNFFHADMHPGNIFVDATREEDPRYIAVDFGIVGTLDPRDQHYLAENFLAFFNRDYRRVARLHIDSGWVPPETRIDELESAIRTVCEPIFNKPLKDISFGQFLLRLFQTARRFDMQVQPQLVLLQKTLLNIEGLGRQLHPELDLWDTAKPILEQWMRERASGKALLNRIRDQLPDFGESIQDLPQVVSNLIQQLAEGRLRVQVETPGLEQLRQQIRWSNRRRYSTAAAGSTLIAGALLVGLQAQPRWLGWTLLALAAALFLWSRPRAGG